LNAKTTVHNFAVYSQKVIVGFGFGFGFYDHPVEIVQALRRTDR
jgi:hypothetical protein